MRAVPAIAGTMVAAGVLVLVVVGLLSGDDGPGDLDSGFGSGGRVTTDFGSPVAALDLAISPDGSIAAAGAGGGAFGRGARELAVARYESDGSLHPDFGSGGKLIVDAGFRVNAVAIAPDGGFVVAGGTEPARGGSRFALARYQPDGSLDRSFAGNGKLTTDLGLAAEALSVEIAPDGGIVAAGRAQVDGADDPIADQSFALARYAPDGSLERSFGDGGTVVTGFGRDAIVHDLAIDRDGGIVAAGSSGRGVLARYTPAGRLDRSFARGGRLAVDLPRFSFVKAVGIDEEGGILVAGRDLLARFTPEGSLDRSFADDGVARSDVVSGANALVLAAEGKVVVAGDAGTMRFAVARYEPDGRLDGSFGEVTTELGPEARALTVAISPGGEIVLAGTAGGDLALSRYRGGDSGG